MDQLKTTSSFQFFKKDIDLIKLKKFNWETNVKTMFGRFKFLKPFA